MNNVFIMSYAKYKKNILSKGIFMGNMKTLALIVIKKLLAR